MYNVKYINNNNLNINYELGKNIIINNDIYNEVNKLKKNINNIKEKKWRLIRTLVTDYEFVGNHHYHKIKELYNIKPISRAYFKLWELLIKYEDYLLFKQKKIINYVGLAEAPGGFIQSFINYRNNKMDKITAISLKTDNKNNINFAKNFDINITYGDIDKNHDGNLLNPEIIDYFCNGFVNKVDFITADGGFSLNNKQEMYKGQYHNHLFLCEIYITLRILKNGGNFILKTYDLSNKVTIDLIEILNKVFNIVRIEKPNTSREMNNENYIVCINYKINNSINNKLFSIINHLWDNKNLILTNILKSNNKFLIKNIINIDKYHLYRQIKKIKYALLLNDISEDDLKKIFKNKYKYKLSLAYKWIKENKII
jgi:23S rRNA U2552 (ribose-2'-O)-methylase RlmE/FtsJ